MTNEEQDSISGRVRNWSGSVLLAIIVQSCAAIWWASSLSSSVQYLKEQVAELRTERYTVAEANKDALRIRNELDDIKQRVRALEDKRR